IPGNTTACVAIVYDINGNQKPNEVGKDIGELNAILNGEDCVQVGSLCVYPRNVTHSAIDTTTDKTYDNTICGESPDNQYCATNRWAGAKKACDDLGMHLVTLDELEYILSFTKKNLGIKNFLGISDGGWYWTQKEVSWSRGWNIGKYGGYSKGITSIAQKNAGFGLARCVK
ncbi:MAG: C-type lectin domain-containing protein, partial [Candidatus Gastranaerophilales bacterium]|nr:C-type lectin domain-containing protein [Candidatus Gastranaerophilales bacterium]